MAVTSSGLLKFSKSGTTPAPARPAAWQHGSHAAIVDKEFLSAQHGFKVGVFYLQPFKGVEAFSGGCHSR